jgi:hypothetical protein
METLLGMTTAAGTTFTTVTIGTNQSLTIRDSGRDMPKPLIVDMWGSFQGGTPIVRVRAASFPENQIGLYTRATTNVERPIIPFLPRQISPQDTLDWQQQGSATAGDIDYSFLQIYYRSSPTIPAIALTYQELLRYQVGIVNAENTLTTGTAGNWGAGETFHAEQNPFHPDTYYALIGCVQQAAEPIGAIGYQAAGFGNVRIAVPGTNDPRVTANYFVELALRTGLPTIFVFKSSSLGTTVIDCAVNENGADPIVNTFYAELSKEFNPDLL